MNQHPHPRPRLLALLLCLALAAGCADKKAANTEASEAFHTFLMEVFREYVSRDTVTMHFKLENPAAYGLEEALPASFRDYSAGAIREDCARAGELLDALEDYDPETLPAEDAFTWKLLHRFLAEAKESEAYVLYPSLLGTNGVQSQIPVTLSEYAFSDEDDVKLYLSLLAQIPNLFENVLAYEEEREAAGFSLPDFVLENTAEQITRFLSGSEEENLLVSSFDDRIAALSALTAEQKESYVSNNRALIDRVVLPAYRSFKETLTQKQAETPSGQEKERLCQYEKGQEYYAFLLAATVGTDRTPEECKETLETLLAETASEIQTLTKEQEGLYEAYVSTAPEVTEPEDILNELEAQTSVDFPETNDVDTVLKSVPDALNSTSACAFYLVPPIDSDRENVIYINEERVDSRDLFSTLAHEGYPGHLYQTNYALEKDFEPIRYLLRCDGYDEGWGTWAQLYSYRCLSFPETEEKTAEALQQLYRDNDILSLCLSSLSDLYVNYENYDLDALTNALAAYGIPSENAQTIYEYVVENPTVYLSYSIGYCEFADLLRETEAEEGDSFDRKAFHTRLLDAGSCPFPLLRERLENAG